MNRDNIKKLIELIKINGQEKFNMRVFIGEFCDSRVELKPWERRIQMTYEAELKILADKNPDQSTPLFKCNTGGCIAGFATAIATDYKNIFTQDEKEFEEITKIFGNDLPHVYVSKENVQESSPKWFDVDRYKTCSVAEKFPSISNKFLGLSKEEGVNLYMADGYSVWKYLIDIEHPDFTNLEMNEEFDREYNQWDETDVSAELTSVTSDNAIKVLKMYLSGELLLANEDGYPELITAFSTK